MKYTGASSFFPFKEVRFLYKEKKPTYIYMARKI